MTFILNQLALTHSPTHSLLTRVQYGHTHMAYLHTTSRAITAHSVLSTPTAQPHPPHSVCQSVTHSFMEEEHQLACSHVPQLNHLACRLALTHSLTRSPINQSKSTYHAHHQPVHKQTNTPPTGRKVGPHSTFQSPQATVHSHSAQCIVHSAQRGERVVGDFLTCLLCVD